MKMKKSSKSDEIFEAVIDKEYKRYSSEETNVDDKDDAFHKMVEAKKIVDSKELSKNESKKETRKLIFTVIIGGLITVAGNVIVNMLDNEQKKKNMDRAYEFEENGYTVVNPAGRETQRNLFR